MRRSLLLACALTFSCAAVPPRRALVPLAPLELTPVARETLAAHGSPNIWRAPARVAVRSASIGWAHCDQPSMLTSSAPLAPPRHPSVRWALSALACEDYSRARALVDEAIAEGRLRRPDLADLSAARGFVAAVAGDEPGCVEATLRAMALGTAFAPSANAPEAVRRCWAEAQRSGPAALTPSLAPSTAKVIDHVVEVRVVVVDRRPYAGRLRLYHRPRGSGLAFSTLDVELESRTRTTLFAPVFEATVRVAEPSLGPLEYYLELLDDRGNELDALGSRRQPQGVDD